MSTVELYVHFVTDRLIDWLNEYSWHQLLTIAQPCLRIWTQLTYFLSSSVFSLHFAMSRIFYLVQCPKRQGRINNFRVTLVPGKKFQQKNVDKIGLTCAIESFRAEFFNKKKIEEEKQPTEKNTKEKERKTSDWLRTNPANQSINRPMHYWKKYSSPHEDKLLRCWMPETKSVKIQRK